MTSNTPKRTRLTSKEKAKVDEAILKIKARAKAVKDASDARARAKLAEERLKQKTESKEYKQKMLAKDRARAKACVRKVEAANRRISTAKAREKRMLSAVNNAPVPERKAPRTPLKPFEYYGTSFKDHLQSDKNPPQSCTPERVKIREEYLAKKPNKFWVGNLIAEKWTHEEAFILYQDALYASSNPEQLTVNGLFVHLGAGKHTAQGLNKRFPDLVYIYENIKNNIATNIFNAMKARELSPTVGNFNLAWNHGYRADKPEATEGTAQINFTLPPDVKDKITYEANKKAEANGPTVPEGPIGPTDAGTSEGG